MSLFGLFGPPNIEKLKIKGNVKGLIKALNYDKDANIQCSAAEALGQVGDMQAVAPLIVALRSSGKQLQIAVAKALGEIGDLKAVEPLLTLALNSSDDNTWMVVGKSLDQLRQVYVIQLPQSPFRDYDFWKVFLETLRKIEFDLRKETKPTGGFIATQEKIKHYLEKFGLQTLDNTQLAWIAYIDGTWKPGGTGQVHLISGKSMTELMTKLESSVEPLVMALSEGDKELSEAAFAQLLKIGSTSSDALAIRLLDTKDSYVKRRVMDLLVKVGDTGTVPSLIQTAYDTDVAEQAIRTLEKVLERNLKNVASEDLQAVVDLDNLVDIYRELVCRGVEETERPVDTSRAKQFARQELIRRGLKA